MSETLTFSFSNSICVSQHSQQDRKMRFPHNKAREYTLKERTNEINTTSNNCRKLNRVPFNVHYGNFYYEFDAL